LADFLFKRQIPLVALQAYGLLGYLRNVTTEQLVVESHPTNDRFDLYIHPAQLAHFPALNEFVDSFDLKNCDEYVHAHVPYIVILGQLIKQWAQDNGGKVPQNFAQQKAFKELIHKARREYADGSLEENFEEAIQYAYRAYDLPEPDDYLAAVYNDSKARDLTKDSNDFWVLVGAVNEFKAKEGHGCLPVSTALPDMHSETKHYVRLKTIFAEKALQDLEAIVVHVSKILTRLGRAPDAIARQRIEYFVRNVRSLRVVRTRTLEEELNPQTFLSEDINEIFEEYVDVSEEEKEQKLLNPKNLHWYFALRSVQRFFAQSNRYPGVIVPDAKEVDNATDAAELVKINDKLFEQYSIRAQTVPECLQEIVRYGASELHNIAAFMGGVGAQEVLKILIKQYVPLNNTFLFNGIHGSCSIFKL